MSKLIQAVCAVAVSLLFVASAHATVLVNHTQTTLGLEFLGNVHVEYDPPAGTDGEVVRFNIVNETSEDWTDYHLEITRAPIDLAVNQDFNVYDDSNTSIIGSSLAEFLVTIDFGFDSAIPVHGNFGFELHYAEIANMHGHIYNGYPTYDQEPGPDPVPEPSIIALMGLGLLGFIFSRRKIKK